MTNRYLSTEKDEEMAQYKIVVKTGTHKLAGTDAGIHITLTGEKDTTSEVELPKAKEYFEPGVTDAFDMTLSDLGNLKEITLRIDSQGKDPGWYLEKVAVIQNETGETWEAQVNKWFKQANKRDPKDTTVQTFLLRKSEREIA